jgi:DNA-binding CsgD family transcriptional regulator
MPSASVRLRLPASGAIAPVPSSAGSAGGRRAGDELTATERRVAELVAEGRTNKEVAAALFVTVLTVESNLTRIYSKLGIRSRTELAAGGIGADDEGSG